MRKYLHKFNTEAAFDTAYNGEDYHEPWVSLVAENGQVNYNKKIEIEYVDLGLPSGTLWATHYLGATEDNPSGDLYYWGEIEPLDSLDSIYKFATEPYNEPYGSNGHDYSKYNNSDNKVYLDSEDDAAIQTLGNGWHIPTREQVQELVENCTISDVGSYQLTLTSNINGNTITLIKAREHNEIFTNEAKEPENYVLAKSYIYTLWFDTSYGGYVDCSAEERRFPGRILPVKG